MKGVIYARYSSDNQREESIEGQIRENMAYAERNGIEIVGTYIDRAYSARTDKRPDFLRMIKDSAKRKFDVVIVWKLDRFSRNRYDSAKYKAALKKNDVRVISATEPISEDPTGILVEGILEANAEYYSADLAEKVNRGLTENALKCIFNGGTIPYGFCIDEEQRYQIDPVQAPVVQEMFLRYAGGETMTEIVEDLNARGLRTAAGNRFNKNSLTRSMLVGDSANKPNGVIYRYYKCAGAKRHECDRKAVRKDWIEDKVVEVVASIIHNEENLCHIADELMALLSKGSELIPILEVQLKEVRKSIRNMMRAIEQGIITRNTKEHLLELEAQEDRLVANIQAE